MRTPPPSNPFPTMRFCLCGGIAWLLGIAIGTVVTFKVLHHRGGMVYPDSVLRRVIPAGVIDSNASSPSQTPPPGPSCVWRFVNYTQSAYEQRWTRYITRLQTDVCGQSNAQAQEVQEWVAGTAGNAPPSVHVFSQFTFENECTGETTMEWIEPLAGLLRSPLYCLEGDAQVTSKAYLMVSPNVSKRVADRRAFYFDLGASLFHSGLGGASQVWFDTTYSARGVRWTGIFAWESEPHAPTTVWNEIPSHLKPVYHWLNIAVNPERGHPDNALEYLRQLTAPEDFVVLKLDIDNTAIEEALVAQIMEDPQLLARIDDFYFEHHVNTAPMHRFWGTYTAPQTLADSYHLFTTLRARGVMAHAWV